MKQSSKRIFSILLSASFIIGVVMVFSTLIRPEINSALEMRNTLFSKQQVVSNQRQAVETAERLITSLRNNDQLRGVLQLALPRERQETEIMNQVNAISEIAGVQIQSIGVEFGEERPSSRTLVKPLGILEVEMDIDGEYARVRRFVEMLETNVRIFNIEEASISSSVDSEGELSVSATLSFEAYFQVSDEDQGSEESNS